MIHARKDYMRIQDPEGKIGDNEPVFLLRAQDELFVPMLCAYISMYWQTAGIGKPQMSPVVDTLGEHIKRAIEWQKGNITKRADVPHYVGK